MKLLVCIVSLALMVGCGEEEQPSNNYSNTHGRLAACAMQDEGRTRCSGKSLQRCDTNKWRHVESCAGSCVEEASGDGSCIGGAGGCSLSGAMRCSGDMLQSCDGTNWQTESDCVAQAMTCDSTVGACTEGASCANGTQRCNGSDVEECGSGSWWLLHQCSGSTDCQMTSATSATCSTTPCADGEQRCSTNVAEYCSGGSWVTVDTCLASETCTVNPASLPSCESAGVCDGSRQSTCDGAEVVVCQGSTETNRVACSSFYAYATCYETVGSVDSTCLIPSGGTCYFDDGTNSGVFPCGSGSISSNMACDASTGCVSGYSSCTAASVPSPYCLDGSHLTVGCVEFLAQESGQHLIIDCASQQYGGGTCTGSVCLNTSVGDPCSAGVAECDTGLSCNAVTGEWGTCQIF